MIAAAPQPKANQGAPLPRIDGRLKVTGEARYAADLPVANLAYGVLVTSDIARGDVTGLRLERARAVPGVIAVLGIGDFDELAKPEFGNSADSSVQPMQTREVRHDGQIIALAVAETFEAATEAANLVTADYAAAAATATLESHGTEMLPAVGNSKTFKEDPKVGEFEAAFRTAEVTLDAEYRTPPQHHNAIELFSTTAIWADDQLTIHEPTQTVYGFRGQVARQLKIDPANVRVLSPYVGGAFGSKGPMSPRTAIVAAAARRLRRPIRCVVGRDQAFTLQTYRAETRHHVRLAASRDGKLVGYGHEGWELTSRPDSYVVGGTEATSRIYSYGSVASKVTMVRADRPTPGYMRAPAEVPYVFALESAMDEMAEKLGMDPVAFRRANDTMNEPISGKKFTSRSLMPCFDAAAEAFGWAARKPTPASTRDGEWLVGLGCATAFYPANTAAATARVRISATGSIVVQVAAHEIGTGVRTVAAQTAAERLGADPLRVSVEAGDTNLPPAPVAGGSNSTGSICSAILLACDRIRERMFQGAARGGPLQGRPVAELDMRDGAVVARDGTAVKLADLLKGMGAGVVEEYAEFVPHGAPPDAVERLYRGETSMTGGSKGDRMMFSFGASFVEVRVHARTREIRVPRVTGAFAAGRIMNTRTARSQLMGGLIWGVSSALHEATEIDPRNARTVNRDLHDYLVPVNADIGQVDVLLMSETDEAVNPAGVKGVGELGIVGVNAAVANAVYNATGKRVRELPLRLEKLLA